MMKNNKPCRVSLKGDFWGACLAQWVKHVTFFKIYLFILRKRACKWGKRQRKKERKSPADPTLSSEAMEAELTTLRSQP